MAHIDEIADESKREDERARLLAICSKCKLGEDLPGDRSISLDTIQDGTVENVLDVAPNAATTSTFDPGVIDGDAPEPTRPTNLPTEDEDKLRQFLTTVTGLDALAFLAALHFARRGRSRNLAQAVRDFATDVRAYAAGAHGMHRATMTAKWYTLTRKIPAIAVFRTWSKHKAVDGGKAGAE